QIICKSESVSLSASNVTNLEVYADPELNHLLYTGQPFVSGLINQDTTFYVISTDSTFQSNVQEVKINLSDLKANFINSIDTLDTSSATIMNFDNDSQNDVFYYWVINDEVAGINQSINFDYAGLDSFDLKLIAEDADGCLDTLGTDIIIPQSATPADVVFDLCKEESGIISALDGEIYVFYSDASKSNIIRKGTNLSLANIQTDTTIYFSNINLFGESSLASATYDVNEIQASFNLDNTLINGASQSVFSPINNSSGATKWRWSLDGELISEEENPDIDVGTPDDYVLTLEVQNDIGCLDNTSLDFRIVTITGVEDFDIDLKLFPNPTSTSFQITSPESISYKVIDFNGSTIIEGNSLNPNIDLSNRPNGVYFISIEYQGKVSWRKVIKTD
ncbi:MAG: T9SS type A sorting domain-containing protein, partial [Bacteroidota bacterium]